MEGGRGGSKKYIGPFTIVDNGLRSFIAPCFCFKLIGIDGKMIELVSNIELLNKSHLKFDAFKFVKNNLHKPFFGELVTYEIRLGEKVVHGIKVILNVDK